MKSSFVLQSNSIFGFLFFFFAEVLFHQFFCFDIKETFKHTLVLSVSFRDPFDEIQTDDHQPFIFLNFLFYFGLRMEDEVKLILKMNQIMAKS